MWQIKTFKTKRQMENWIVLNGKKTQYEKVFIENGYAVEYRELRIIRFK